MLNRLSGSHWSFWEQYSFIGGILLPSLSKEEPSRAKLMNFPHVFTGNLGLWSGFEIFFYVSVYCQDWRLGRVRDSSNVEVFPASRLLFLMNIKKHTHTHIITKSFLNTLWGGMLSALPSPLLPNLKPKDAWVFRNLSTYREYGACLLWVVCL